MEVLVFGQLKEIIGSDRILFTSVQSTDELNKYLNEKYPGIAALKYLIAVDKEVIQSNTTLREESTIALLPPYAGG